MGAQNVQIRSGAGFGVLRDYLSLGTAIGAATVNTLAGLLWSMSGRLALALEDLRLDHYGMIGGCADDAEFTWLVRNYRPRILRHITSLVRDACEAEDLTQEAFLRARRGLPDVHDRGAVGSWLYRVATNVSIDWLRAERRRATAPSEPSALETIRAPDGDTDPGPVERLARSEMSTCVDSYIDGLREDYRTAIVLHDIQGLSNPEIAALLGWSVGNVKIKVHRARAELRAALERGCSFETDERGVTVCEPVSAPPAGA